jgi:hypothetical protein
MAFLEETTGTILELELGGMCRAAPEMDNEYDLAVAPLLVKTVCRSCRDLLVDDVDST